MNQPNQNKTIQDKFRDIVNRSMFVWASERPHEVKKNEQWNQQEQRRKQLKKLKWWLKSDRLTKDRTAILKTIDQIVSEMPAVE